MPEVIAFEPPSFEQKKIERDWIFKQFEIHTDETLCDILDVRALAQLNVKIPPGVTSITLLGGHLSTGVFDELYKLSDNTISTYTVTAGKVFPMPEEFFAEGYIKIKGNAAGTAIGRGKT